MQNLIIAVLLMSTAPTARSTDGIERRALGGVSGARCADSSASFRYGWRGFMLDECRHFFGKGVVKQYLDRMAAMNLNVFHWHLTDDQAWRLDIPGLPELVKYGATRSSTPTPGNNEDSDGKVYGPYFYTPDDVCEIVAYAAERGIRVVPEIELPGHARALLAAHPEFACEGVGKTLTREPWTHFGICKDVLCAGNDEALRFYERVLNEVMKMFPGEFIHIGGDECPKDNWKKCPRCQARIKALGLKDERALQGWVTTRMANYIASKGRRAIGWDEVLDGADLPKSTVIQSWRGAKGGIAAAKAGHDVIMSPCEWTYFTFAEGLPNDPYKYRPWVKGKFLSAAKMRAFDPEAGVPAEFRHHIIGAECCAWSEILCDVKELEFKTLHRMPAFAEAVCVGQARQDGVCFEWDIPYGEGSQCRIDVKWPLGATNFPTVVWLHGGGLEKGEKHFIGLNKSIAQVAVSYRLLKHGEMEDGAVCIRDAAAAVAWTLEHISEYGGDPKKVYVSGMSAGGYLTMMVGMAPQYLKERGHDIHELAGIAPISGQATKHFNVRKYGGDKDPQFLPKIDALAPLAYCSKDIPPIVSICGEEPWEWKCRSEENRLLISSCIALGHAKAHFVSLPYCDHGRVFEAGVPYVEMFVKERIPDELQMGNRR